MLISSLNLLRLFLTKKGHLICSVFSSYTLVDTCLLDRRNQTMSETQYENSSGFTTQKGNASSVEKNAFFSRNIDGEYGTHAAGNRCQNLPGGFTRAINFLSFSANFSLKPPRFLESILKALMELQSVYFFFGVVYQKFLSIKKKQRLGTSIEKRA